MAACALLAPWAALHNAASACCRTHACSNPDAGPAARARFHELQEAYSILRDEGRRAQYDRMRSTGFAGGAADFEAGAAAGGYGTPWGQPSMDARDFDKAFDEWWKKMSEE